MNTSVDSVLSELDRLMAAIPANTHVEAARLLEVRQSLLSDSKRRGGLVSGVLLGHALKQGIRLEWIKNDNPPMKQKALQGPKCEAGKYCFETCPALEAAQRVLSLISSCGHICGACKYKREDSSGSGRGEG